MLPVTIKPENRLSKLFVIDEAAVVLWNEISNDGHYSGPSAQRQGSRIEVFYRTRSTLLNQTPGYDSRRLGTGERGISRSLVREMRPKHTDRFALCCSSDHCNGREISDDNTVWVAVRVAGVYRNTPLSDKNRFTIATIAAVDRHVTSITRSHFAQELTGYFDSTPCSEKLLSQVELAEIKLALTCTVSCDLATSA